jgi:hypothetical protein
MQIATSRLTTDSNQRVLRDLLSVSTYVLNKGGRGVRSPADTL